MSAFDFYFTLFGLVLCLTLVSVLSGLAKVMKATRPAPGSGEAVVRPGLLTPLLGLFVLLDVTSYGYNIWEVRQSIPVDIGSIFAGLFLIGTYYVAAALVFPERPEAWPQLDAYFWAHKRQVLGCILAVNLIQTSWVYAASPLRRFDLPALLLQLLYFIPVAWAWYTRRPRLALAALAFASALYLVSGLLAIFDVNFLELVRNDPRRI